jgi:hypothetical protein
MTSTHECAYHQRLTRTFMLTPQQADAAAKALAMHSEIDRRDWLACPACSSLCISPTFRRHMGLFNPAPCPHCGALLRLKGIRAWLLGFLLLLTFSSLTAYMNWPTDRRLVQTLAGPFIGSMIVFLTATIRRLRLVAG